MAALVRKQSRRKGLRTNLESLILRMNDALSDEAASKATLLGLKNNLCNAVEHLATIDEEILGLLDPDDVENDVLESCKVLDPTYGILAEVNLKLESLDISLKAPSSSSTAAKVKLPKLELPNFKGDPLKWQGFWDMFQSSVHENDSINDIDRFSYLKRYLSGQALDAVSGLSLTSSNYIEAVKILQDRYGNPQVLISAHMDSLIKMVKIRNKDDVRGLRKLYDDVENCVRNLKTLKLDTSGYGSLLIPILKDKMPDEINMIISRKFGSAVWSLELLMEYFHDELRALENCRPSKANSSEKRSNEYTASGLFAGSYGGSGKKRVCLFCDRLGHGPSQCRVVSNVKSRRDIVRKKGRCFICLEHKHLAKDCKSDYQCRKCDGKHHISICSGKEKATEEPEVLQNDGESEQEQTSGQQTGVGCVLVSRDVLLKTAVGELSDVPKSKSDQNRVLFDDGSQRTYILENVCERLNLTVIRQDTLVIKPFGSDNQVKKVLNVVQLLVRNKKDGSFVFIEALVVPFICSPLTGQSISIACEKYDHLSSLELADIGSNSPSVEIGLLIGADFYNEFFTGRRVSGGKGEPVAYDTLLGWVLCGPVKGKLSKCHSFESHAMLIPSVQSEPESDVLRSELNKFWSVESVDTEDDCVVHQFQKDIVFNGERYVTKLPFKPDHDTLPDNYCVSERRLVSLRKKLVQSGLLEDYNKVFRDFECDGMIEKVPLSEIGKEIGEVHYLPHRPIVKENRATTKIRPVFDASCATDGPSLNQCLYSGPNLLGKIFDVLLRFRLNKYAILADIKQAFLHVDVAPEHIDFLRFLWYDLSDTSSSEIFIYRFLRVVFGLTSSPFLLGGTIRHHLDKYVTFDKDFVKKFIEDLYVDDSATGCGSVVEGVDFYEKAKRILGEGGFVLRKWMSNSVELQSFFDEKEGVKHDAVQEDISFCESQFTSKASSFTTVLGVEWDKSTDEFVFNFGEFLSCCRSMVITKRNILSVAASLYDPLGLVSPITARIKSIFQKLCKDKSGWDDNVSKETLEVWREFVAVVERIPCIRVSRFILTDVADVIDSVQLHGFCDSSTEVYCGIVYLRIVSSKGVNVSFVASKTKVVPLQQTSMPRLELLACCLLSKLVRKIKDCMSDGIPIFDSLCWSDSSVALCWIKGKEKSWKPWVENRCVEVRKVVDRDNWSHISGELNPADIPTRMYDFSLLNKDSSWYKGPSFLYDKCFKFNSDNADVDFKQVLFEAKRRTEGFSSGVDSQVLSCVVEEMSDETDKTLTDHDACLSNVIDSTRYSSLKKLVMVTCYVKRFVTNLLNSIKRPTEAVHDEIPGVAEYNQSLDSWIADEQKQIRKQSNFSKMKSSLKLFEDEKGFLRLRGRFGNANWNYDEKYPLLLRNSYFTRLVILDAHDNVMHHGVDTTLAYIRTCFWIVKGRKTVKDVLRKCVLCKRFQGVTLKAQPSSDLPDYRVNHLLNAFQATGLDFAGPLYVKDSNSKNSVKTYVLLLTCANSRAIHLELVTDMKVPAFLRGFKRFVARRGIPEIVVHDNAKTFRSAEVKRFMTNHGITQKFILPASPWWGGFYERLVRSVKPSLKKVLGRSFVSFEELQTILCEIESVLNSRPLTYVNEDDLDIVLTPNHLIYGRDISKHVKGRSTQPVVGYADCSRRVKHVNKILLHFWNRFKTTYLNELRQRHLYVKENKVHSGVSVNDVVLIKDDIRCPRTQWRMGKVEEVVVGRDELVRGAKLAVLSKEGFRTIIHRPVEKLIPFEITEPAVSIENTTNDTQVGSL